MYLGQNLIRQSRLGKVLCVKYSRTSRKRPPKVQRLSGRLRKVLVARVEPQGGLFREEREEVQAPSLYGRSLFYCMQCLS